MLKIENGRIIDPKVEIRIYPTLEHGDLSKVASIVLHRTDSSNAEGTLSAYANGKKSGAHFLIGKDGHIYQTANLKKYCHHVGILLPRCQIEASCDPNELKTITALIHEKGLSFSTRANNLSRHEANKKYPLRYPANHDSIGIEVVGRFLPPEKAFEKPTPQQFSSVKWLVDGLAVEYSLNISNHVYAHGAIARKEVSEGAQLLQHLFTGATQ